MFERRCLTSLGEIGSDQTVGLPDTAPVGAWSGYQRSQPCDERQGVHHDMGCSVAEGVLELMYDLTAVVSCSAGADIDAEAVVG